jgi:GNAT superfamily N-acetyltransferase
MIIRHPKQADWKRFSSLACAENWSVQHTELQLFKGSWAPCAHVLDDDGFCGLVTAVAYEKSAWIGNLIVPHDLRGKGYGRHLFKSVLAGLVEKGMASVWLTASEQGRKIYEREGFVRVDGVERWVLPSPVGDPDFSVAAESTCEELLTADRLVWGEDRNSLLSAICKGGKVFTIDGAIALLQSGPDFQVVGPWYSHDSNTCSNKDLLQSLIASSNPSVKMVIDCLSSSPIPILCESVGFKCTGKSPLMAYGDFGSIDMESMMSLASLGSVG